IVSRFLKNFPRLFSGNYSNKNTNTIKPLKNQHSTQPTHATRRQPTNNQTDTTLAIMPTPNQHQTDTAQTSHQTEYHTGTTSNATLQDNRTQLNSHVCSLFSKIETNAG
ncbi:hypothetical protein, partial [Gardnerella vaginalis]|uniref:hypothetical protein n=1 Tax=Gardnerella vaginalis TaxID=2702 RepID=UPI001FF1AFB1